MISIRRAVIFVAQILALIFIVVATMAGALAGDDWLSTLPMLGGVAALPGPRGISIIGALAGFFLATMVAALFFLCVEIAYNTRNPFTK